MPVASIFKFGVWLASIAGSAALGYVGGVATRSAAPAPADPSAAVGGAPSPSSRSATSASASAPFAVGDPPRRADGTGGKDGADGTDRADRADGAGGARPSAARARPAQAPPCDGIGVRIIVASADDAVSRAVVVIGGETAGRVVGRGDPVGDRRVVHVAADQVWLARGDVLCRVELFGPVSGARDAAPAVAGDAAVPRRIARADVDLPPAIAAKIARRGPGDVAIDRDVREYAFDNYATIFRGVRVVPAADSSGKMLGMRVDGFGPESLLGRLGLAGGDVLGDINGIDLTSPENAMGALARFRTADHLRMTVRRGAALVTLDVDVQ